MKRLLLAPLLIALTGCSNELIVKTDLAEKWIVKNSAVKVTNWTKSDAIRGIKAQHPVQKCIERKILSSNQCLNKYLFSFAVPTHLEKEKKIINSEIQIPYKLVRFRPIFVDVNNDRSANIYLNASCINYSAISNLEDSYIKALTKASIEHLENIPDRSSDLTIEDLKKKVCDKYAKFNLKEIDPELKTKDSSEIGKQREVSFGIGLQKLKDEEYTEITSVVDFLSADLKVGDKILIVNDMDTKGMTTDEILELLKGEGLRLTLREKAIRTEKGTLKQVFLRSLVFAY